MHQRLQQGLRQEMLLLPKMVQALEVLQLPALELETFVREAALENEALRLDERPADGPPPEPRAPRGSGSGRDASDRHAAWLENQADGPHGLVAHLEEQLAWIDVEPDDRPWVQLVIDHLDPTGILASDDDRLLDDARSLGLVDAETNGAERLGRAIATVQRLEPRGVGGRDVVETLLLQLDPADGDYGLLCRLLEEFLDDVTRNKLPKAARGLGVEIERLGELLVRLRELDPAPGAALSDTPSPVIEPDVVVERTDASGGFRVRLVDGGLAPVELDADVKRLAKDPQQSAEVRKYLREKLERARWLIDALAQRQETLLRVATWVFQRQRAFLLEGPSGIVPLTMTDAANDLGIHVSTVSRAVAGKYADTPWGLQSLRSLFPSAAAGDGTVSRASVQDALRALVDAEDGEHPLSDDELAEKLRAAGFQAARRTVAKYRGELGIPSSYRRRRYA